MSSRKSLVSLELISRLQQFPRATLVTSQNAFPEVSSRAFSKCYACSPIINPITPQLSSDLTWKINKLSCDTHLCNCNVQSNVLIYNRSKINISSIKRDLSTCTPVYQNDPPGNRNGSSENKTGSPDKYSEKQDNQLKVEEAYDPKKDSFFTQDTAYGSKENKGRGESERPVFIPPEENTESSEDSSEDPPTNCCMTGCPNCVWIEYVEKLTKKYSDPKMGREKVLKELEALNDNNIKAFIMMELRIRKLI